MPSKVTVTVVLTQDEKDRLQRLADSQERSLSYLAGKFIKEALARAEAKPSATPSSVEKEDVA
jgi:predicted transcriptional regulator